MFFFYYDYFKPESQRQNPNHEDRALNKKTSIRPPAAKSPKKISFFIIISRVVIWFFDEHEREKSLCTQITSSINSCASYHRINRAFCKYLPLISSLFLFFLILQHCKLFPYVYLCSWINYDGKHATKWVHKFFIWQ